MWRRLFWIPLTLAGFALCFSAGLLIGLLAGERGAYHRRYLEERALVAPLLAADPAFGNIEILERSDGGIDLSGQVDTPADRDRLRELMVQSIGNDRVNDAMYGLEVENSTE